MCPFSDGFFQEVKKFPIPYIPVVKHGGDIFVSSECIEPSC